MMIKPLILAGTFFWLAGSLPAADMPDPYRRSDQPVVGPAPVPVMEQVFWVQVQLSPWDPVNVSAPEGVRLLDQTRPLPGRESQWTRFYFRSDRGLKGAAIVLTPEGAAPIRVPLNIRTYREDIETHIKAVSGVDPSVRKRGRAYYTDERIGLAKANLSRFSGMKDDLLRPTAFDTLSDSQLFDWLPSWNMPRQTYSNWPCPYCGTKVYTHSAFYPWGDQLTRFKAVCPECKRSFPSNDITRDDFTGGEFPDDGWGCDLTGSGKREDRAGWVANANQFAVWHRVGEKIHRLALRYLLLDDNNAAHRAALLLARIAYVYPGMDTRWQQVLPGYLRPGKVELDQNWEYSVSILPAIKAYDALYDYIGQDRRLAEFLRGKDPEIKAPDDVRALIETYLIQTAGWNSSHNFFGTGDNGWAETILAWIALLADMGPVSDRWIEGIFTHGYNSGMKKGGVDDVSLLNYETREGPTWIGAFGYSTGNLNMYADLAEALSLYKSPRWAARCNLWDPALYPRVSAVFTAYQQMQAAGQFFPCYGDHSNALGDRRSDLGGEFDRAFRVAYRAMKSDELARYLYARGRTGPEPFEEDIWPEIEAKGKKLGPSPPMESRVMDGVGMAFLESRPEATAPEDRAAACLRYGYGWGHTHHDNLNIEMWAKGVPIAPELGYPTWAHPMGSTTRTAHHNTGMIDRKTQYQGSTARGTLNLFAGAPEASFTEILARPDNFPNRYYRRAAALLDAPGGNAYLLDVFRMAGGKVRTYSLHGPPYDDFRTGLSFGSKEPEAYYDNLIEPQTARSDGPVRADWKYLRKNLYLSVHLLPQPGRRYITAAFGKPDSPPVRFLMAEDDREDGASEFVALWEPHEGESAIEKIERLPVSAGKEPEGFRPVALRVTLKGGQIDTILYAANPTRFKAGDIEFEGTFGYYSETNGRLRCLHLANGRRLTKGRKGIQELEAPFQAKIAAADPYRKTIRLNRRLPKGSYAGQLLYIGGRHPSAYHIVGVVDDYTLRVDYSPIIFRSRVDKFEKDHLVCELDANLEAPRFTPGYYDGAFLSGEPLKGAYRVTRVEGNRFYTNRQPDPKDFPDADGDSRRVMSVYDFGPGDEVALYRFAWVRREADGKLTSRISGKAVLVGLAAK
ncbi:MAG: heparinase II/III family protein [Armatimonadetes bacterium]|nr:heparinase II/III family protein [Armatimonadota bacterium]